MRVYALVEGKTESQFIQSVLAPHLFELRRLYLMPVQIRTSLDHLGGMTSFVRVERQLRALMKQHRGADVGFTTMFDLFALPKEFPGFELTLSDPYRKAQRIEVAMSEHFNDRRLLPYIQVHEFEALVFTDLSVLPPFFPGEDLNSAVEELRTSVGAFTNPELINDRRETSPSHRLIQFLPGYEKRKTEVGPDAAKAIGLKALRQLCPHFAEWIGKLEALAPFQS